MNDDVTRRRTSGDSSPSITAPLVSTWMIFGVGNGVDVAMLLQTGGIGHGEGGSTLFPLRLRVFQIANKNLPRQTLLSAFQTTFPTKNGSKECENSRSISKLTGSGLGGEAVGLVGTVADETINPNPGGGPRILISHVRVAIYVPPSNLTTFAEPSGSRMEFHGTAADNAHKKPLYTHILHATSQCNHHTARTIS